MYRQKWAGIVYGRSYHLDFRFIAIPRDFTSQELDWASPYILATTRKAKKLPFHPRWSLFKNDSYCVLGVTCMVRDLLGELDENSAEELTRDDRGRPLYVFVGYATKLERKKYLFDLPSYTGNCLEDFQSLYQYVREVWLVKNFDKESRKPQLTDYQKLTFANQQVQNNFNFDSQEELNYQRKCSDKVFLWQDSPEQNRKLWTASANFPEPTSICLGINNNHYLNSPFLNQTLTELEQFTIQDRVPIPDKQLSKLEPTQKRSLSQVIAQKAKQDIDLTLQHATQAATLGQELIDNLTDWSANREEGTGDREQGIGNREDSSSADKSSSTESKNKDTENFGFKTKSDSKSATKTQDWF